MVADEILADMGREFIYLGCGRNWAPGYLNGRSTIFGA